jgi:hypothetical protein
VRRQALQVASTGFWPTCPNPDVPPGLMPLPCTNTLATRESAKSREPIPIPPIVIMASKDAEARAALRIRRCAGSQCIERTISMPTSSLPPHTPLANFLWAHVGWVVIENPALHPFALYERYARDLLKDPFYRRLERKTLHLAIIASWILFLSGGLFCFATVRRHDHRGHSIRIEPTCVGRVRADGRGMASDLGGQLLSHMGEYRNYATDDDSRYNMFVGIVSNGEGLDNNNHADQRSARHGHHWWELDTTYLIIRLFATLGLICDVVTPKPDLAQRCRRHPSEANTEGAPASQPLVLGGHPLRFTQIVRSPAS